MVGLIDDLEYITTSYFKDDGDLIYVIGEDNEELGGSEYLKIIHNKVAGDSPKLNLQTEKTLHDSLLNLIRKRLINSAHDISEGGIGAALAECCIINHEKMIGCEVKIPVKSRKDFSLFSESQSRVIISILPEKQNVVESELNSHSQSFKLLGKVVGQTLKIKDYFEIEVSKLSKIYYKTIPRIMGSEE